MTSSIDNQIQKLEKQRSSLVQQMLSIRTMTHGKISKQFYEKKLKGSKKTVKQGPYYVLSVWKDGRNQSRRIRANELDETSQALENHRLFTDICAQFIVLTERLGELKRAHADTAQTLKKTLKSP